LEYSFASVLVFLFRSFFWHVLMPSSHLPEGNGLIWRTIYTEYSSTSPEGILLLWNSNWGIMFYVLSCVLLNVLHF